MSLLRPLRVRYSPRRPNLIVSGRLTQDFDGSFYMERPGYLRTDVFPKRGARWRWHSKATARTDLHLAHDYGAPEGTPVYATGTGKIVAQGRDGTGGWFVYQQIRVGRVYKVVALYYHLKPYSLRFKVGDTVERGQVIASVGNTGGSSTGAHLHFQIIRYMRGVSPRFFYTGANAKVSLGLTGVSFDPQPLINGTYSLRRVAP